ncbi:26S proteasome non-ATPase regulatory subunit 10-like [Sitodiplosis mosellana]|uniref:26S proteasome non-ATPase regulatory subunit 10-like n=1 Tax=Sitodiplosis mosellana TaxID=263140 RepID=UPI002444F272|nr:26S proteasome non-ATPase regulatory subunit 10-like [Sitodiplosis mosellana]
MAAKVDLMQIASEDFVESESKILEDTSLVTQKDANHRTILHWAAVMGKERLVEFLLKFKDSPFDEPDDTDATPLILATLKGSLPICRMLIDRGANVNHRNSNGHTPIKYAGSKNHKDLLSYLLDHGGDPNVRDHIGDTPLHRVASMEHHECLRILLTHPKSSPIILINAQNNLGNTPLHLACEGDDATGAILLIDAGASTEICNKEKASPLDVCKPPLRRKLMEHKNKTTAN